LGTERHLPALTAKSARLSAKDGGRFGLGAGWIGAAQAIEKRIR
jgi:hypothetical protein